MTQVFSYSWKEESSEEVSWRKLQFLSPELVQNVGMHSTPPKRSLSMYHSLHQPYAKCYTKTLKHAHIVTATHTHVCVFLLSLSTNETLSI